VLDPAAPFALERFVTAQASDYAQALSQLRAGHKRTHWIWYVLPQLRALGRSPRAQHYGLGSAAEARAYLAHPVLGPRLRECAATMNALVTHDPVQVLGPVDAAKFQSCLTLFLAVAPEEDTLRTALDKFYGGVADARTLALLRG